LAPLRVSDPNPVSLGVGNVPISPDTVVAPVLVIPDPASTAKLPAVPRLTGPCAANAVPAKNIEVPITIAPTGATRLRTRRGTDRR